jgi:hypothetical protein
VTLYGSIGAQIVLALLADLWLSWMERRQARAELERVLTPAEQAERQNAEWWRRVGGVPEQLRQNEGLGY